MIFSSNLLPHQLIGHYLGALSFEIYKIGDLFTSQITDISNPVGYGEIQQIPRTHYYIKEDLQNILSYCLTEHSFLLSYRTFFLGVL